MFNTRSKSEQESSPLFSATMSGGARRAKAWLDSRLERARREPFAEIVELSPELAELLLSRNACNRSLKEANLAAIRQDVLEGRWALNGEPLIVSGGGELNDGQHRCQVIAETGRSIKTFMSFGVSRESRSTTDSGIAKTPGDHLAMIGINDSNHVAAVAAFLWQIERFGGEIPINSNQNAYRPTKAQVQETALRHRKKIEAALGSVPNKGSGKIASRSQLALCRILIDGASDDTGAISTFFARLIDGVGLPNKDPILVARERLMEEKRRRSTSPFKTVEIAIRAWNMHRRGDKTTKMQLMESWPKVSK